jgi:hypothetical protein
MLELLTREPWLIPVTMGFMIPIAGIVVAILKSVYKARQTELEISLKRELLERGMSADEIIKVLQVRSGQEPLPRDCASSGQGLPLGTQQT